MPSTESIDEAPPATVATTEFREIYVRDKHRAWCRLLWQDSGRVIILSDYGNWSYWWGHRGDMSVPEFLAKLGIDYMGKKMLGTDLYEYSNRETVAAIRQVIIECRKSCGITKTEARGEWDLVKELESGDISFDAWYGESTMEDGCECDRTEICAEWQNFWDRLWVPLIAPALKEAAK